MPITFIPDPVFVWTRPAAPTEVRTPAPAPPAPARKKPGPKPRPKKPRSKKPKGKARRLTPQLLSIYGDRLEAAIEAGLIDLNTEAMDCDTLDFTPAELVFLWRILWPDLEEQAQHLAELQDVLAKRSGKKKPREQPR